VREGVGGRWEVASGERVIGQSSRGVKRCFGNGGKFKKERRVNREEKIVKFQI
jgi:hypothetical protein